VPGQSHIRKAGRGDSFLPIQWELRVPRMVLLPFFSSKTCGNNVHGNHSLAIRLPQKGSNKDKQRCEILKI